LHALALSLDCLDGKRILPGKNQKTEYPIDEQHSN